MWFSVDYNGLNTEEIELLAKRLAYLWNLRDQNPREYSDKKLGHEKEGIYMWYGPNGELSRKSQQYYHYANGPEFQRILKQGSKIKFDYNTGEITVSR